MMNFLRENKPELNIDDKEGNKESTVLFIWEFWVCFANFSEIFMENWIFEAF